MGQYWTWCNISGYEHLPSSGKMGEWLGSTSPEALIPLLGMYTEHIEHPLDTTASFGFEAAGVPRNFLLKYNESRRTTIASLSREIHDYILNFFEEYTDVIFFSLTCRYMCDLAHPHLVRRHRELSTSWSGHSIICVGDYTQCLPSSVLKQYPTAEMFLTELSDEDVPSHWQVLDACELEFHRLREKGWDITFGLGYSYRIIKRSRDTYWQYDQKCWVLRNLSKKLFVKEPIIRQVIPDDGIRLGLGHVLGIRCGWSEDDSCATAVEGLNEGKWAGDNFDVVVFDEDSDWAKEWEDVSEETRKEMKNIYIDQGI